LQAEDGIRAFHVTGVQTCALPIMVLTTPGISPPAASRKMTSKPGSSSISLNWSRGTVWMFCGLPGPKPRSGSTSKLRLSPALRPNRLASKPGSRLPSPTLKVAGALPTVESTTSPLGSFRVKCRVTSVSWLMRMSVMSVSNTLNGRVWLPEKPGPALRTIAARAPLLQEPVSAVFFPRPKHIQNHQRRAYGDGAVSDIEGREEPALLPMHQDE